MTPNNVFQKIQEFVGTEISVDTFLSLLKTSSKSDKMNVRWRTEGSADGSGKPPHTAQYLMWWDSNEYVGGDAGGSDTKELQNQLNLRVTDNSGKWRTLSYDNIDSVTFKRRKYIIK
jgi:hypothetical protein